MLPYPPSPGENPVYKVDNYLLSSFVWEVAMTGYVDM